MVGMGPAWALATEVGTLGQGDRGELPFLTCLLFFFFCLEGEALLGPFPGKLS